METLFIQMPSAAGIPWQLFSSTEVGSISPVASSANLDDIKQTIARFSLARHIVILPTADVLMANVNATAKQLKQVGASIAYLLEEQLGQDIDDLHVVQAPLQANDQVPLLVIEQARLADHLATFHELGLRPHALIPDALLLPLEKSTEINSFHWALQVDQFAVLRTQMFKGAALEADLLQVMLDAALTESNITEGELILDVYYQNPAILSLLQTWINKRNSEQLSIRLNPKSDSFLSLLTQTDANTLIKSPFNVLQGKFAKRTALKVPASWKWAAAFVGLAFSVQVISEWVQYAHFKNKASTVQQNSLLIYKSLFPEDRGVSAGNLKRRMEAKLQGDSSGSAFLPLLTQLGEGIQGTGLNPQSMDFDAAQRKLVVDINAQSVAQLESLKQQLESNGLTIEIQSASAQGSGVRGRLKVTMGEV